MKPKCPKCLRTGHTAENCYFRNFPFANQGKIPPRVNQTGEPRGSLFRVNCTTTGLLSIVLQRRDGGRARFFIDTGAGINLIKEKASLNVQTSNPKTFLMGSDKHAINKICNLTVFKKNHQFYVVPNNFPLIEDGIIGLPFLTKYQYSVTNHKLTLDKIILPFQKTDSKIRPGETLTSSQHIEGKPTAVCFINTGKQICHITNEIEKPDKLRQINKFAQIIRTKHIEPEFRGPLEKILIDYLDVFNMETDSLPCTKLTEHTITLKTDKTINIKSYRRPECHKKEIETQINDMLDKQIIEPSGSPYNAPIWVVPKKLDTTGKQKWRIVIDFRKLNEQTDQEAYPLSNSDEILDYLGKAKFFSALDLSSGFHQIPKWRKIPKNILHSQPHKVTSTIIECPSALKTHLRRFNV